MDSDFGLYRTYRAMIQRCKDKNKKYYYVKGIKVEWLSYKKFKEDMYESYIEHLNKFGRKNTTIDRINSNGNYCKKNCRWATSKEQQKNIKSNVQFKNEIATEASKRLNGYSGLVSSRIRNGWAKEKAFYKPKKELFTYKGETIFQATKRLGGHKDLIRKRLKNGWDIEKAFSTPPQRKIPVVVS